MKNKTCAHCNKKKQADKFYLNRFQVDCLSSICIKCHSKTRKEEAKILRAENHFNHIQAAVVKAKKFLAEYEELELKALNKKFYRIVFDLSHELTKIKFTEKRR